jgi:hypothetical protein
LVIGVGLATGVGAVIAGVDWPGSGLAVGLGLDTAFGLYEGKYQIILGTANCSFYTP